MCSVLLTPLTVYKPPLQIICCYIARYYVEKKHVICRKIAQRYEPTMLGGGVVEKIQLQYHVTSRKQIELMNSITHSKKVILRLVATKSIDNIKKTRLQNN